MSIKVMTAVFDRYPNGGGEMLLALALADHASDDGSRIFPSVKHLAEKTRQGERSVQYQLRRMEESGWLILVNTGNGGRNQHREYQISPDWLKGAEIAPPIKGAIDDTKGAIHNTKGCNPRQERVQPVAPAYNHHRTVIEPSEKGERASTPPPDISASLLADYLILRKAKKAGPLTPTAIAGLQREADKAGITLTQAVTACCEFGWQGFDAGWYATRTGSRTAAMTALNRPPQAETFAERDARAKRDAWEAMTNRPWPEQDLPKGARGIEIIEVQATPIRRIE